MSTKQKHTVDRTQLVDLYRKALAQGVPIDQLEDKVQHFLTRTKVSEKVEAHDDKKRVEKLKRRVPLAVRLGSFFLPVFFILIGLFLVGSAVVPIVWAYVTTLPTLQASALTAPIPQDQVLDITPLVITQAEASSGQNSEANGEEVTTGPVIIDTQLDYTNLSNWFADDSLKGDKLKPSEGEYIIDIPKLDVKNAKVVIGGTDLNKSLIQYPGTAMPGEAGAPVIFGHSILPQFYNPSEKNPRRYNSIFTKLMSLQKGDEIHVTHDGVKYTYEVLDKTEVKPEDVHILSQQYDSKLLKLVTCTPAGTYLRRGVIRARLVVK
jgi:LPXTG-site transpeptidase (sortase) family protein